MPTDYEPRIWWNDHAKRQDTRCIACGSWPFNYDPERASPHLCPACTTQAERRHPAATAHRVGFATDLGRRHVQADAAAVYRAPHIDRSAFAVADGVGDEYDAADAARLAVWATTAAAVNASASGGLHAARAVWHRVYEGAPPGQAGHAVVVVAVPLDADHGGGWDIAWSGDTRAYLYTNGELCQLTTDHTQAEHLRAKGFPAEWIGPQDEHTVTATIGTGAIASIRTTATGRLLLCSDGVYGRLTPATIARGLRVFTDPAAAATRLIRAARRNGSTDNATALVIDPPSAVALNT